MSARTGIFLVLFLGLNAIATPTEVQGHRGCRGILPENTLHAFEAALKDGIDVLEMDLAVTRDKKLVVSHDPFINPDLCRHLDGRELEAPLLIHALSLLEVKSYDCGSKKNPRFDEQQTIKATIPTLEEVFALVQTSSLDHALRIGFNIETKIFPEYPEYTVGPEEFSELVVIAFRASGFMDRITLQSFDKRTLIHAKKLVPSLRTVMLIEDSSIDMISLAHEIDADAISPDVSLLSLQLVQKAQAQGLRVIPWTVNDAKSWQKLITWGVDGIITDYPQKLKRFLGK